MHLIGHFWPKATCAGAVFWPLPHFHRHRPLPYDQSSIHIHKPSAWLFFPRCSYIALNPGVSHVKILYKSRVRIINTFMVEANDQAYVRNWVINIVVRKWFHGSHLSHSLISRTTFLINLNLDQPVISCWLPKKNLISWHNLFYLISFPNNCP